MSITTYTRLLLPYLRAFLRSLRTLRRKVAHDHCLLRASSLSFSTLLALVPLTAFVFSLFAGFGAFNEVRERFKEILVRFLMPTRQEEILLYIETFIENSKTMGVVGLFLFALTSLLLLNGISGNINAVWGSSSKIGFVRKFSLYISIIVFGTLFLGAGFTFIRFLGTHLSSSEEISAFLSMGVHLLPSLLVFFVHWLIIYSIPSAHVNLSSSLLGAFLGTLFWEAARFGFVDGTNYVLRMSVIYGSLASIPIFLVWLSIQWFIILLAVEISYIHQYRFSLFLHDDERVLSPNRHLLLGLKLYISVAYRFYNGLVPFGIKSLSQHLGVTPDRTEYFLQRLNKAGLLSYTYSGPSIIVPQKEPAVTSIQELLTAFFGPGDHFYEDRSVSKPGEEAESPGATASHPRHEAESSEVSTSLMSEKILERFFRSGAETFTEETVLDIVSKASQRETYTEEE